MIEFEQSGNAGMPEDLGMGVRVIGVGGAGANVLDRMALEGSDDAELLTLNTDIRALSTSVSSEKIQLGATLLKGMGTGGDPTLGKQAALEAVDEIREAIRGRSMVFLCVGLGGGTGSGAGPEVCRIAREEGVFLVVFATMPFTFEGERRMGQAREALDLIGRYANAVITFDNDRMGELIASKDGIAQAFAATDKIISQSIRATMNVVFRPGIIRIGMDDLLSALRSEDSRCLFGYGVAKGDNRAIESVEQALKCPLLDRGKMISDSRTVLVQVSGGENMTLFEVKSVMQEIAKHVGPQTQILFGTGTDKRLGGSLAVTLFSSIPGPGAGQDEADVQPALSARLQPPVESALPASLFANPGHGESHGLGESQDFPAPEYGPETHESLLEEDEPTEPVEETKEVPEFLQETAVFESLEGSSDEDGPVYRPQPIPGAFEEDDEDLRNPIARAMAGDHGGGETAVDRVEAVTDSSQRITLSRVASGGSKSRDPLEVDYSGLEHSPEVSPEHAAGESELASDAARQQQDLLQLEPVPASKGRFAKGDPTIVDGEDLDVPAFLRKK